MYFGSISYPVSVELAVFAINPAVDGSAIYEEFIGRVGLILDVVEEEALLDREERRGPGDVLDVVVLRQYPRS